MEVRIGIAHTAKELVFTTDLTAEQISNQLQTAAKASEPFVLFKDIKGREIIVPLAALSYLECGSATPRKAGFVS